MLPTLERSQENSERAEHSSTGEYVEIDCHDASKFKSWSNADLATTIDVVAEAEEQYGAGRMYKTRLEEVQRHLGFRATKGGLLACPELRRCVDFMATLRYDWPHTFLSDGILGAELWALMAAGQKHELFSAGTIREFLQEQWQVPAGAIGGRPKSLQRLLDDHCVAHNEEHQTMRGP